MTTLAIDIETFSSVDLAKSGAYKYCESEDFEILIFAYSVDGGPVEVVDLGAGEGLPTEIALALTDTHILKVAFNAAFERTCLARHIYNEDRIEWDYCAPVEYEPLPPEQWSCTMVKAAMLGLPLSLGMAAKALKLDIEKDTAGTALINYFSKPCKPTKANGYRTRNLPKDNPEKWAQYKAYCKRDVEVEREIGRRLEFFTVPPQEVLLWNLDQRINDAGILMEPRMIKHALEMAEVYGKRLHDEAVTITGLSNPNSGAQLKKWLSEQMGQEVDSLTKAAVPELLSKLEADDEESDFDLTGVGNAKVRRMLEIRQEMSKTSVKKYKAMEYYACQDFRARGLFQFGGASKTFRWSGRGIQLQNLPQNHLNHLDFARNLVIKNDIEGVEMMYGNVPDTLSQLIRTSFIAKPGHRLIVADFAAIELIVGAWLAGEQYVIDEFKGARKNYEKTASKMFNVPFESISKDSPERQKGKIASLACQYGGGVGALAAMDTKKQISDSEKPVIVSLWRQANPKIVKFWYTLENAAKYAIKERVNVPLPHNMAFFVKKNILFFKLPSGRCLTYINPTIGNNKFGGEGIFFEGINQDTRQWGKQDTYGGKLFENLCQAVARDCLAEAMLAVDKVYPNMIVVHVHDELGLEVPNDFGSLKEVCDIMARPIPWAKGLPLAVEGFETNYYKK